MSCMQWDGIADPLMVLQQPLAGRHCDGFGDALLHKLQMQLLSRFVQGWRQGTANLRL